MSLSLRGLIAGPGVEFSTPREILASIVVFLVALPLCIGVAAASGAPPALGLVTGIIGGLVVGSIAGSPLQVSGPAAGLIVLVFGLIQEFGLPALGVAVLVAGLIQLVAGLFKLGRWFRATSPAVIHGMLAGIGVLIFANQFHVMLDAKPPGNGLQNLLAIPSAIWSAFASTGDTNHHLAAAIGAGTILTIILWERFRPKSLKLVPGALLAVVLGTLAARLLELPLMRIDVPTDLTAALNIPGLEQFKLLADSKFVGEVVAIALIASAETLLCATAVDQMHSGPRTNYDRELAAQGVGNMLCGVFGALPMTGVIVRSSANVAAGAKTRLSTILHGAWLLLLVVFASSMLSMIPSAVLAAILVFIGYKLVNVKEMKHLWSVSRAEFFIYVATLFTIVAMDLLTGVILGLVMSAMRLLWIFSRVDVRLREQDDHITVELIGAATFVSLPLIAQALESLPTGKRVLLDFEKLAYVDHACIELFQNWSKQYEVTGGEVTIAWASMMERFNEKRVLTGSQRSDKATAPVADEGVASSDSLPAA